MSQLLIFLSFIYAFRALGIDCYFPPGNECSFYQNCIEELVTCGEDGYAIGYGKKYCLEFKNTNFSSKKGNQWRDETLKCLQQKLVKNVIKVFEVRSCHAIRKRGFDSHAPCYLRPDQARANISICVLPLEDIITILNIVDIKDIFNSEGRAQASMVGRECLRKLQIDSWFESYREGEGGYMKVKLKKETLKQREREKKIKFFKGLMSL